MKCNRNVLSDAVRVCLAIGAMGAVAAPAVAQDEATLDRIEVTGSRIKRAEVEGPSPVTVITRQDLDVAGELSISDFLRNNVYNSFGSTREASGSATGSQATISLRGLGSQYTLVLLDGRRMTKSAALNGGSANINLIPTAAVERIEILREGAGAVYGSDAIGGVINIILRKDYEGMTVSAGYEAPTGPGPDGNTASISGGISSERGNITYVVDHQQRDMMYNRELRGVLREAGYGFALSAFNSSAGFFSPSTGLVSVANCDQFENSIRNGPNSCGFEHGATSANESSLSRDSLLVNGNYELTENVSFYFRGITSDTSSLGVYAAAPVDTYPTISASNPFNPFGVDGTLYYRFTPLGTRDTIRQDTFRDISFGLQGTNELFGGADWQFGVGHGRVAQNSLNYNYGLGSALQDLIDAGSYNPFDPNHPSVAAGAPSVAHTVYVGTEQRTVSVDGNISFDLFDIGDRTAGFVAGFDYLDDRLEFIYDAQSAAGNVFGSAGAGAGGERASYAVYFEGLLPLLDTLSVTVAGRYDSYNDAGSKFSPRVSLEFRPLDSLLVRGSWGKGFRAPTLVDLAGDPSSTNLNAPPLASAGLPGGDQLACNALTAYRNATGDSAYQPYPVNPCATDGQYQFLLSSNPFLVPEESQNWGVGVVWSPSDALSFAVDYYDIEIENVISNVPRSLAFQYGNTGVPGYGVDRTGSIIAPNGAVLPGVAQQILLPSDNGALQTSRGVDFEVNYRFDVGSAGSLSTKLAWAHTLEYDFTPIAAGTLELIGTAGYPENRGQLAVGWERGDFGASVIANYIDGHSDGTPATSVPSWTTFDVQAHVNLPWRGKVTAGIRNLDNKMPPFNNALYGFPFYDNTLYNIYGRVPYLRYEQSF